MLISDYSWCLYAQRPIIKIQQTIAVAGVLGSPAQEGIGFFRSEHQPSNDLRPYLQSSLQVSMLGNHSKLMHMIGKNFNLNEEVKIYYS